VVGVSVFNKVLASIGIGSAKVDTKLKKSQYMLGEEVSGVIEIQGGSVQQQIDELFLTLHTNYKVERDDHTYEKTATINHYLIHESFTILPNEKKEVPFRFQLPFETPLTVGRTKVWIKTGMDIKNALDPKDEDYIQVVANPLVQNVLTAIGELGFQLREVECEETPFHFHTQSTYLQEFEYVPVRGAYRGKLKEVEFVFFVKNNDELELLIEIDRRARGLGLLFGDIEKKVRLYLTSNDTSVIREKINDVLRQYS
jgi:sporulation-control protein